MQTEMYQFRDLLFKENEERRIFLRPHLFFHPFHFGRPLFGAPFLGGFTGGMIGSPLLSPYGYGYPYYGYGYPSYYPYY